MKRYAKQAGVTLLEVLIASAIFIILAVAIFFTYGNILEILNKAEHVTLASVLLGQEMEFVRNLNYDDVGIEGGSPPGVIPAVKEVEFQGVTFQVYAFVRNIDDYFDGTVTTTPQDTAPADRKLIELRAECETCFNYRPVSATSWVAPAGLEATSQNGSLFINVFDANGAPVQANVLVENTSTSPAIEISDTTNVDGVLQLIDLPTSTNGYQITITKTGYSSARTYEPGGAANPNPLQPHSTVATQELTTISFTIDQLSDAEVFTTDSYCQAIPGIELDVSGAKLVGASPNVLKFEQTITTDSSGLYALSDIEWDTYSFVNQSTSYEFAGSNVYTPLIVDPNTTHDLYLNFVPANTNSLLVSVINASGTLVTDADVSLWSGAISTTTKTTGYYTHQDSDWSAGQGSAYSAQDGSIDDSTASLLSLQQTLGLYPTSSPGWLTSNTINLGTSSADIKSLNFRSISMPAGTSARLRIASNNDNSTWTYVGPDGSTGTSYAPGEDIDLSTFHDGNQFLRYRLELATSDEGQTPTIDDIEIVFSSPCVPQGNAIFQNLSTGTYNLEVTASGYEVATATVPVATGWQEYVVELTE
ncbi:MAG: prepilin-type N-terminal cleavage/methylation domain-containing protein [Candidatus Paceibacterota bacterium]